MSNTQSAQLARGPVVRFPNSTWPSWVIQKAFPNATLVPGNNPKGNEKAMHRLMFK